MQINVSKNTETEVEAAKAKLKSLLRESDWTQLPDVELSSELVSDWRLYRSQLRGLLSRVGVELSPARIKWPSKPE